MNSYRLEDDQLSLGSIDTPAHSPGPKSFHSALSPQGSQAGQDTPVGSAAEAAADTGVQPGAHSFKIRTAVQQLEGFRRGSAPGSPPASASAGAIPAGSLVTAVPGTLPSTPAATAGSQQQVADSLSSSQCPADSHDGGLAAGGILGDGRRVPGAAAAEPSAPGAPAADSSVGAPATSQQSVQLGPDVSATPPSTPTQGGAQAGTGAAGGQHSPAASTRSQLGAGRQPAAPAQAAGTGGAAGSSLAGGRQLGAAQNEVDRPTAVKMAAITDPDVGPVETAVAAAAALQADKEQAHQQTAAAEAPTVPGPGRQDLPAGTPSDMDAKMTSIGPVEEDAVCSPAATEQDGSHGPIRATDATAAAAPAQAGRMAAPEAACAPVDSKHVMLSDKPGCSADAPARSSPGRASPLVPAIGTTAAQHAAYREPGRGLQGPISLGTSVADAAAAKGPSSGGSPRRSPGAFMQPLAADSGAASSASPWSHTSPAAGSISSGAGASSSAAPQPEPTQGGSGPASTGAANTSAASTKAASTGAKDANFDFRVDQGMRQLAKAAVAEGADGQQARQATRAVGAALKEHLGSLPPAPPAAATGTSGAGKEAAGDSVASASQAGAAAAPDEAGASRSAPVGPAGAETAHVGAASKKALASDAAGAALLKGRGDVSEAAEEPASRAEEELNQAMAAKGVDSQPVKDAIAATSIAATNKLAHGSGSQSDAGLPTGTTAPPVTPTASAVAQLGTALQAAVSDKGLGATQKVDKAMTGVKLGLSANKNEGSKPNSDALTSDRSAGLFSCFQCFKPKSSCLSGICASIGNCLNSIIGAISGCCNGIINGIVRCFSGIFNSLATCLTCGRRRRV